MWDDFHIQWKKKLVEISMVPRGFDFCCYIMLIYILNYILAESQKPPGLLSIGADEGVRIHILSGRACKTYVKLI